MTVNSSTQSATYNGNGSTTAFPIPFYFLLNEDIKASLVKDGNGTDLVFGSDFSLSGAGLPGGGTLTMFVAPTAGYQLVIERQVAITQQREYQQNDPFPAKTTEKALDKLTMICQQIAAIFGSGTPGQSRALLLGKFDVNGAGAYQANNNRITKLGDPQTESDAVNQRSMFSFVTAYIDRAIAGVVGGFGWFLQAGIGAGYRTFQDKMRDVVSIKDFGAIGDGNPHPLSERFSSLALAKAAYPFVTSLTQTIDWAAMQAAINFAVSRSKTTIDVPAGTYYMLDPLSATFAGLCSLAIRGAGGDTTEFKFINVTNGFSFTLPDGQWWLDVSPGTGLKFSGFTVSTNNNGAGTAISIYGGSKLGRPSRSIYFEDVIFRGQVAYQQAWATSIDLLNVNGGSFNSCVFQLGGPAIYGYGVGVNIHTTDANTQSVAFYFNHCRSNFGKRWLQIGSWCEGVYVTQCSSVGADTGIYWNAGAESGLHIIGGHYSNFTRNFDLSGVNHFEIMGALLGTTNDGSTDHIAINLNNGGAGTIVGNTFTGNYTGNEYGVRVANSPTDLRYGVMIEGNTFSDIATAGVFLDTTSQNVVVGPNQYARVGTEIINSGTRNRVSRRRYVASIVVNLTGGNPTEPIDIPIPVGMFNAKPSSVFITSSSGNFMGFYQYASGNSLPTNLHATMVAVPSGNLPSGAVRLSVIAEE